MSSSIRGITVEIGGNTTKLQNALKDVNNQSRNLQSELRQVDRLLQLDPGNTELIAQRMRILEQQTENTAEKLRRLEEVQEDVNRQFANGQINEEQYRAFNREIERASIDLRRLENAADDSAEEINDLGDESDKAESKLKKLSKSAGGAAINVAKIGAKATVAGMVAVSTAVAGTTVAMFKSARASSEYADNLNTLSAQTNINAKTLQELEYAMKFIDVDVETVTGSMAKLIKNMDNAQKGSKDVAEAFERLGVNFEDSSGNLRSNQEVFYEAIDALGQIKNETERDAMAMRLFGKSAQDLNPLIKAGAEQLKTLSDEAHKMGAVLSEDALADLQKFDDTMQKVESQVGGLKKNFGTFSAGAFLDTMTGVSDVLDEVNSIFADGFQREDINQLSTIVSNVLDGIVSKIVDFMPKMLEIASNILSTLANSLLSAIPQVLPTITQGAITLLNGLISSLKENAEMLATVASDLIFCLANFIIESLPTIIDTAIQIVITLANSFAEKLPDLIPVFVEGLLNLVNVIIDNLPEFIDAAIEVVLALTDGILNALPSLLEQAPVIIEKLVNAIIEASPKLVDASIEIILSIVEFLVNNLDKVFNASVKIVLAIGEGLIKSIPQLLKNVALIPKKIIEKIMDTEWFDIGINVCKGIANGISKGIGKVVNAAQDMAKKTWNTVKDYFGIHSPSRLAIATFKKDFAEDGIGGGILKGIPEVVKKTIKLGASIVGALEPLENTNVGDNLASSLVKGISTIPQEVSKISNVINSDIKTMADSVNELSDTINYNIPKSIKSDRNVASGLISVMNNEQIGKYSPIYGDNMNESNINLSESDVIMQFIANLIGSIKTEIQLMNRVISNGFYGITQELRFMQTQNINQGNIIIENMNIDSKDNAVYFANYLYDLQRNKSRIEGVLI